MPNTTQLPDPNAASQPPRYVPPHRNGTLADTRYSKDQLLDLYKTQQSAEGGLNDGLPSFYMGGWQPDIANGMASASWARTEHSRDSQPGPDVCWDRDGGMQPLALFEMDDEEKEVRFIPNTSRHSSHMLTSRKALLDVCQYSTQTTNLKQRKSAIKWSTGPQSLYVQPSDHSRWLWTPVTHCNTWLRTSPGYERVLSISTKSVINSNRRFQSRRTTGSFSSTFSAAEEDRFVQTIGS